MKATTRKTAKWTLRCGVLLALTQVGVFAQTLINLGTQGRNVDFTSAQWTRPVKTGTALPATCSPGDLFFKTNAPSGQNLYGCPTANTWALLGDGSGNNKLFDPGTTGIVQRNANATMTVPAPSGTIVGTTDAQTLTNKSIDGSEITTGTLPSGRMPALSGDVITIAGSTVASLPPVNSQPGTYGDATHTLQLSVDAKGRVTAVSPIPFPTNYYQTIDGQGSAITPRTAANFSGAFAVTDNAAANRTEIDLATVNPAPGTYGGATQIPVLTINPYGQITAVNTVPSNGVPSGTLAQIPSTCSAGTLYVATDQNPAQQLFTCAAGNTWVQMGTLGGSGALSYTNGSLDIVTSVVPRKTASDTIAGSWNFTNGLQMNSTNAQPACVVTTRGMFWFLNNNTSKDNVQVCVYNGSSFAWVNLY